jgi:uncharacterized protein (TIGR00725 family)
MKKKQLIIGVIGGSVIKNKKIGQLSYQIGKEIALHGHILICGGMKGVMELASQGAKDYDGLTIGILPGKDKSDANPYIDIPIVTAMSHARNAIITRTSDAVIAIDGEYGTLSEIALAKILDKPVYGIHTWNIKGIIRINNPKKIIDDIEKRLL